MRFHPLDPEFTRNWRRYARQSGLAAIALTAAIWSADVVSGLPVARAVLVASIGSTAFVLFITPHSPYATPRHAVGGHAIAFAVSAPFALAAENLSGGFTAGIAPWAVGYSAVAVGVAMLVMAAFKAQHPPAAGTVLAVVAQGFDWVLVSFLAIAVLVLTGIHVALRRSMIDLF